MENRIMLAKFEKMCANGFCKAQLENGKSFFAPFFIPGEIAKIEFKDDRTKITILEPSSQRIFPACPYYQNCGGCDFMHISKNFQITLKKKILCEEFKKHGIEIFPQQIIEVFGKDFSYRARFQLTDGGFLQKKSANVVKIKQCAVATPEMNEYFSKTPLENRPKCRTQIFADSRLSPKKIIIAQKNENQEEKPKIIGKSNAKKLKKIIFKNKVSHSEFCEENAAQILLLNQKISFDVRGFFQSNPEMLEKTIKILQQTSGGKNFLDLYAGAGVFSAFLGEKFCKTFLVEHNRGNLVFAEKNLLKIPHESYAISGKNWLKTCTQAIEKTHGNFSEVVLDPPRSGCEREILEWLCEKRIPKINYLSCDAKTFCSDCAKLIKSGYKFEKLFLLDFFPQTSKIESLAILKI